MMITPTFDLENSHKGFVAGVDEAGRGPLSGPVVAAAVILNPKTAPEGLRDSKTLSEKRREEIANQIRHCADVGVGISTVEEIDQINILQASLLAMKRAVSALPQRPDLCLIDGNKTPELDIPARAIIKGDAQSCTIAAASIIAKTVRDQIMRRLAQDFPHYAWEKNKGYGAPAHKAALAAHGVTPHHRKSFAPIHNILHADSS